jgi:peptidoglycan/xylan/chitin deacetylase (PgdA/CDA1 family)
MRARYLIRLDDALPTMHAEKWEIVESLLDQYGIKPMVAVIPNNDDKTMEFDDVDMLFWERVKKWKAKGWSIGLHGYNHLYHDINKKDSLVPFHNRSEFVGLNFEMQKEKLKKALNIFSYKNIEPDLFIAPSHSFDEITLHALKNETSIKLVSDGISLSPFLFSDIWFVPQQLWKFKWRPFGIWTICLHPNTITPSEIEDISIALSKYHDIFISLDEVELRQTWYDKAFGSIFSMYFWTVWHLRKIANSFRLKN